LVGFSLSTILGAAINPVLLAPAMIYAIFTLLASAKISQSLRELLILLLVIPTMHFAWGAGFLTSPKSLVPGE
jgi:hypothetical protein